MCHETAASLEEGLVILVESTGIDSHEEAWKKTAAFPGGLKLSSSGLISGIPNARRVPPGSYPVSMQVKDSTRRNRQTATATFTLVLS